MHNTIRIIRTLGIYLLPAASLTVAGTLLLGLLYSPTPITVSSTPSQPVATTGQPDRQARADALFAALLADALRQIQEEQETQVRTLRYQYEDGLPSGEAPVMLWTAPPPTTDPDRDAGHPTLIQL
jgi:hypothetical protein